MSAVRRIPERTMLPPVGFAASLLVRERASMANGDMTEHAFHVEQVMLDLRPVTPADAVALTMVALDVIDRNEGCEPSDLTEQETVAALLAIRRSVRLLARQVGVDVGQVLGGYYVDECRPALLEPGERAALDAADLARAAAAVAA